MVTIPKTAAPLPTAVARLMSALVHLCTRLQIGWRRREERALGWLGRAVTAWEAEGRVTPQEAMALRAQIALPGFRRAIRWVVALNLAGLFVPFPLDGLARGLVVLIGWLVAAVRHLLGRSDHAAWEMDRRLHAPRVFVLSLLPGVGIFAYLAAPAVQRGGLLLRIATDAGFRAVPWHLYERSRLGRLVAFPTRAARAATLCPAVALPAGTDAPSPACVAPATAPSPPATPGRNPASELPASPM